MLEEEWREDQEEEEEDQPLLLRHAATMRFNRALSRTLTLSRELASESGTAWRETKVLHRRQGIKMRRGLSTVAKVMEEDPIAGTATLLQMGQTTYVHHVVNQEHVDETKKEIEEQVGDEIAELLLDLTDRPAVLDALKNSADAVKGLSGPLNHNLQHHLQQCLGGAAQPALKVVKDSLLPHLSQAVHDLAVGPHAGLLASGVLGGVGLATVLLAMHKHLDLDALGIDAIEMLDIRDD